MRKHIALFAAFVLAIAFFAGCTVYFSVSTFTFLESGEVTLGERSDAEGLEISSTVEIAGKYSFTGVYDPAAGVSAGTYDEWSLFPSGRGRGSFRVYASVFTASEDTDVPAYREIFLDYMENRSSAANETRVYRLNDFTDTVPLSVDFGALSAPGDEERGYNAAISEALPVPLPGDVYLTVTYGGGLDLDSSYDTLDIISRCTSVLSEGWLYFVLQLRGEDGSRLAGELLDGSLLPGGDWGVFRMPCEDGTPDLAAIENVLVLGRDWDDARLAENFDGSLVYLLTEQDSGVELTVLDAALGDTVQSFTLFTPEELESRFSRLGGISISSSPEGTVFSLNHRYAAVFALEDGRLAESFRFVPEVPPAPDWASEEGGELWLFLSGVDHVPGGGRCASIYEVRYCEPDNEDDMARGWAVAVYEDGEMVYAEWFPGFPRHEGYYEYRLPMVGSFTACFRREGG